MKAVLFDVDGVVQASDLAFRPSLEALCPEPARAAEFAAEVFAAEKPCATGEARFSEALDGVMRRWKCTATLSEGLACWERVKPDQSVFKVVASVRANGTTVALATNQQDFRAAYMRTTLGYADRFDDLLVSCEMGAAKPSNRYFELATEQLGVAPAGALFIDDAEKNVQAAQGIGPERRSLPSIGGQYAAEADYRGAGCAMLGRREQPGRSTGEPGPRVSTAA